VKAALNPGNISAGFGAIKTGFTEGFGQSGIGFNSMKYGIAGGEQISNQLAERAALAAGTTPRLETSMSTSSGADTAVVDAAGAATAPTAPGTAVTAGDIAAADVLTPVKPPSFGESIKDAFTPGGRSFGESMGDAFFPRSTMTLPPAAGETVGQTLSNPSVAEVLQANGINPLTATTAQQTAAQALISQAAPSMLRTYAPLALAGTAVAAGTGMFTPVPGEDPNIVQRDAQGNVITGSDLIEQNPNQYLVGDLRPAYQMPGSYSVPTSYLSNLRLPPLSSSPTGGPFARPTVVQAAEGGAIFPRRNGGIMPDEGIPGKDSVRAMLMPGEFVMTTDAVRGLGNGDLNNGIQNMYSVMRNLENRGRAMA
jgi:hypothetical protein